MRNLLIALLLAGSPALADYSPTAGSFAPPGFGSLDVSGGYSANQGGIAPVNAAPLVALGGSWQALGTTFTISGCSATGAAGSATAGKFSSGTAGTCTVVITINGASGAAAPNGWVCFANDLTTTSDAIKQTASTATTATFSGTTASGDVVNFTCQPY